MAISKVRADWSEGHLIFRDKATRAAIMTVKDGTDGVYFDQDMEVNPQYIKGQRFTVTSGPTAYAGFPVGVFIAPAPCKLVSAKEFHIVGAATTNGLSIVKQDGVLNSAQGTNALATTFNVSASIAAYTVQSMNATNSTGLSWLTTGERFGAQVDAGTNLSGVYLTLTMEWL